jgi:uncharacterized protein (TIGR02145 family)
MTAGTAVSGVKQTITVNVTTAGTYSFATTAPVNGVTFAASGTFTVTGSQTVDLTATGTPTTSGSSIFTLNTTPNCNFTRTINAASVTCGAYVDSVYKQFMCYNLGVTGTQDPLTYQTGNNNGALYQWGRNTDGHEVRIGTTIQAGPATSVAAAGNKFITNGTSPFDWITPQSNTLWGDGTSGINPAKSTNDPCPTGFKVPSRYQLSGLFRNDYSNGGPEVATQNTWEWTGNGYKIGAALYLPAAGGRGANGGLLEYENIVGFYWSSTSAFNNSYYLRFENGIIYTSLDNFRGNGFSVRCIAE